MPIRLVSFDCANTLLRGSWDPVGFALWAAREAGLALSGAEDALAYFDLQRAFYPEILDANRTGDLEAVFAVYERLGRAWLVRIGHDPDHAPAVVAASRRLLTDHPSGLFIPFRDTVPTLIALRERGVRIAVVSNWDVTLEPVLQAHGLRDLVDDVYASLVVGAEKPDPTMLRLAIAAAGVRPDETLHVGDDPTDDLGAAASVGVTGLLIKRSTGSRTPHPAPRTTIRTLTEVLDWIA